MRNILTLLLVFSVALSTPPINSLAVAAPPSSSRNFRLKTVFAAGNVSPAPPSNTTLSASRRGKFLKRYDVTEGDSLETFSSFGRVQWREGQIRSWSRLSRNAKEGAREKGIVIQDGAAASFLDKNARGRRRAHQKQSALKKQARVPDHTDPETVLTLGRMTFNSYIDPEDKTWIDIPGWDTTDRFGWVGKGIRGYVFTDDESEQMIIVLKGTTLATPVGGGPTAPEDKFNDNMMFSCCCAKAGWSWRPICDCPKSGSECSLSCLIRESNFDHSYYNLAQTIYLAVRDWFPKSMHIWMAGHSLGGALASLIALTNDLPAFAYEAPGDLMYAQRIGLLPDLPPSDDPDATPDWTDFLSTLPIYHFGNTLDPIFLGECTGPSSSCYWFDYALEMKCHVGYECIYDDANANQTTSSAAGMSAPTSDLSAPGATSSSADDISILGSVRYHTIDFVIKNFLEKWDRVPECKVVENCLAKECQTWTWTE
ncbi:putative lipase atg15 [Rhizophlyctis rosea]|uniref:triacylglycerol lipase n=1 Tax=Rhizophlyctis rosea TaxID=64517 RepID=A0AAD5SQI7_9FUNG|nr:putative lipase atg15 [Rhizophlyctis rosea]